MKKHKRKSKQNSDHATYKAKPIVVRGWGGFETESTRMLLKEDDRRQLDEYYATKTVHNTLS